MTCTQSPEAYTLRFIRNLASKYIGELVTHAVLTIPAHANDTERQALKDAATLAGLDTIRVLNAPTAAAIAHGLDKGT
jgi:molecular chaperone DnaK (HSP70)